MKAHSVKAERRERGAAKGERLWRNAVKAHAVRAHAIEARAAR